MTTIILLANVNNITVVYMKEERDRSRYQSRATYYGCYLAESTTRISVARNMAALERYTRNMAFPGAL